MAEQTGSSREDVMDDRHLCQPCAVGPEQHSCHACSVAKMSAMHCLCIVGQHQECFGLSGRRKAPGSAFCAACCATRPWIRTPSEWGPLFAPPALGYHYGDCTDRSRLTWIGR